ncbi:MAG: hypothetical protein Q9163_004851, partial [Psora crenata]
MATVRDPKALAISPPPSLLEVDERTSGSDQFLLYAMPPRIISLVNKKKSAGLYQNLNVKRPRRTDDLASIPSSVKDYEYENGRRYHGYKAGSYPLPNDEKELDRIDLNHHIMMLLCNGYLHLAPLADPKRVLDIGTGTGIWAIEMGEQYPEAEVTGIDLQPASNDVKKLNQRGDRVPDNVIFEIDDIEAKDWTWPDNHFDYIHSRFMLCSISSWKRFIRKAFRHIKPGGYFELQELDCRFASDDGSLHEDSNLSYWSRIITEASADYNRPVPLYTEYIDWFEKAGFVDIQQITLKCPTNPWPKDPNLKEVGKFQLLAHVEGLEGMSLALLTRGKGWKADEVSVLMAKMRPELKDRSIHSYQT